MGPGPHGASWPTKPQAAPAPAAASAGPSVAEVPATVPEGWEQAHMPAMLDWLAACGMPHEAKARQLLEGCLAGLAPTAAAHALERLLRATIAW